MRNNISVLVVDPLEKEHDYTLIKTAKFTDDSEENFDIKVVHNTNNIMEDIDSFRGVDSIITIGEMDFGELFSTTFEIRKRWVHFDEFNPIEITNTIIDTLLYNINRERMSDKLFSIFTCTHKTDKKVILRLYNSLKNQIYKNWNWYILDDSEGNSVTNYIAKLKDPRIFVFKNISNHGNIGFNKHMIASMCDGDYLLEVDHDDELTPDCLSCLYDAFLTYPDTDFVYSNCIELMDDNRPIIYPPGSMFGQIRYMTETVNGWTYDLYATPDVNAVSIRTIYSQPNHVRCWKKNFYHKIGGHNIELSVLDDMDILLRTFINGKMCKVNKVLYIQHEGNGKRNGDNGNTQSVRFKEIQRLCWLLKGKYDKDVHERILALGGEDVIWNEEGGYSDMRIVEENLKSLCYVFQP